MQKLFVTVSFSFGHGFEDLALAGAGYLQLPGPSFGCELFHYDLPLAIGSLRRIMNAVAWLVTTQKAILRPVPLSIILICNLKFYWWSLLSLKNGVVQRLLSAFTCSDTCIQTGNDGRLKIGPDQPRCHFQRTRHQSRLAVAYKLRRAAPSTPITALHLVNWSWSKPLQKRSIIIDDDAWLGFGVSVGWSTNGKGGAGAVVTHDVPDGAIVECLPVLWTCSNWQAKRGRSCSS